ncbi:MAG TPA: GMP synthase subunit A [Candidatus Bathyarchaeia archaeon]|nr:GMP synthase subunit A [Candidatus Bathyarchaeia archaeon]
MTTIPVVYVKGQYNHLIVRNLKELGVESKLQPPSIPLEQLEAMHPDALVMGGGPQSVRSPDQLTGELADAARLIRQVKLPMLCICVTHQLLATAFGGVTEAARKPEFGPVEISVLEDGRILEGLGPRFTAWESHNDEVVKAPEDFQVMARSSNCAVEAIRHNSRDVYGVQFHPEVSHTTKGVDLFKNFLQIVEEDK